jgi:hypothetical protein
MRINEIKIINEAKDTYIEGTNCHNCKWAAKDETKVDEKELDPNGGLKITNKEDLKLAAEGDLVTLPGKKKSKYKFYCEHNKIKQFVTERMCCLYWDADGVYRAFGKSRLE